MLRIDQNTCIGCGICEENCPFGSIEMVDGLPVVGDSCNLCGACVEACDVEALTIDKGEAAKEKDDLDAYSGVWVFCEFARGTLAPVATELLGIGQMNTFVGDFEGNTRKVIETIARAEQAHPSPLVVFPELTATI